MNDVSSNDVHTLSGAYALDALSPEEATDFADHLVDCEACRDEVAELRSAAALMGAAEAVEPPASLRARVLAAAAATPQLPALTPPTDLGAQASPREDDDRQGEVVQMSAWRRRRVAIGSAAAAVVLAVTGGVIWANNQGGSETPALASGVVQVFDAGDARTSTVTLKTGGTLTLAVSRNLGEVAVDTRRLPRLGSEKTYQLWTVAPKGISSAGVVENAARGATLRLPAEGVAVAVSVEPAGGSTQPTTEPIAIVNPADV